MPGLFDAHGHIDCCFGAGVMPVKQPTRYAALAYGVTTNFDPYSNELTSYESGEMTLAGETSGRAGSARARSSTAGRASRIACTTRIASLEDARNIVRRKQALGGDILKSYKLPTRAAEAGAAAARPPRAALMVDAEGAGHFYDNVSMILDGHTNLEHNLPVANYYDDLLQLFQQLGACRSTPTLIVTFGELFGENYIYQHQEPWKETEGPHVHSGREQRIQPDRGRRPTRRCTCAACNRSTTPTSSTTSASARSAARSSGSTTRA